MLVIPNIAPIFRSAGGVEVADVFSAALYTGNGSTQSITNGIDLDGEGGAVWIKGRSVSYSPRITDTERAATNVLYPNGTQAEGAESGITAFNSDGFDLGSAAGQNENLTPYVAWSFRKAAGFFDVVSFTFDAGGSATIPHGLGATPGMAIVKLTNTTGNWFVWHKSLNQTNEYMYLNTESAKQTSAGLWTMDNVNLDIAAAAITSTTDTGIAYFFGHDTDGIIQCGSYTGNGSASGPSINLGWEPQFLMIKSASTNGSNWEILDESRGLSGTDKRLFANLGNAESTYEQLDTSASGFSLTVAGPALNSNATEYIYMAIKAE